eukprot:Pgem_evm1s20217
MFVHTIYILLCFVGLTNAVGAGGTNALGAGGRKYFNLAIPKTNQQSFLKDSMVVELLDAQEEVIMRVAYNGKKEQTISFRFEEKNQGVVVLGENKYTARVAVILKQNCGDSCFVSFHFDKEKKTIGYTISNEDYEICLTSSYYYSENPQLPDEGNAYNNGQPMTECKSDCDCDGARRCIRKSAFFAITAIYACEGEVGRSISTPAIPRAFSIPKSDYGIDSTSTSGTVVNNQVTQGKFVAGDIHGGNILEKEKSVEDLTSLVDSESDAGDLENEAKTLPKLKTKPDVAKVLTFVAGVAFMCVAEKCIRYWNNKRLKNNVLTSTATSTATVTAITTTAATATTMLTLLPANNDEDINDKSISLLENTDLPYYENTMVPVLEFDALEAEPTTTNTTTPTTTSDSSDNLGLIIGCAAGGAIVLFIVAGVGVYYCRNMSKERKAGDEFTKNLKQDNVQVYDSWAVTLEPEGNK